MQLSNKLRMKIVNSSTVYDGWDWVGVVVGGWGEGEAEVRVWSAHFDTNVTKHMLNNLPIVAVAGDGGLGRGPSQGGPFSERGR